MKNKLFPLISILVLAILFGIAATCSMCRLNLSTPTASTETTTGSETTEEKSEETATVTEGGTTTVVTEEETTADVSTVIEAGIINHATKQIALTFDAGWEYENTEALLNLLDKYNVKATFFVRGLWVKDHPDLAKEIVNQGHALENHSLTHGHMNTMTDAEVKNEIHKTTDIIRETTGYLPNLFRPPYGEYDKKILRILKEEGYPYTILWTVDSYDWAEEMNGVKITKDYLIKRVLSKASDNGIILMHVGGYKTIDALPEIIIGLRSKGYELVKINDML
ncbi:MAG: polysaccharide deacetylase family protein [Candidatus Humimicrobiaceae bacterium]